MRKKHLVILGIILLVGLIFRTYQVVERFEFAHDGDLYSWIVKDIVVNHHIRLIGQLTSAPGIFIGGLFYYLLIPFFLVTKMDPIGVIFFAVIIGLSTIFSYYFVLSKLFKIEVGLIAASLYATLLTTITADRWVVPTITTYLWVIWYFYSVVRLIRGDFKGLVFLGILVGLIWHVHIALLPALIAIPAAIFFSKKLLSIKQTIQFFAAFFITSLPFILFEVRHGFSQTLSFINNFLHPQPSILTGFNKLLAVIIMVTKNLNSLFFAPQSFSLTNNILVIPIILLAAFWLVKKKVLLKKELIVFCIWIIGVIGFFGLSSSPISEYYFINIEIIFVTIASLFLYLLYKSFKIGKILTICLLIIIPIKNGYFMVTQSFYHKGYIERKAVVSFIKADMEKRGLLCSGISYITAPGENVGFRYFFYLENVHLVHPSLDIPVYNIVLPDELSPESKQKFGHIGLILPPTNLPSKETIEKTCQGPNTNLTDPVFGYVE